VKIAFFELEDWEKGYIAERVHNQDIRYYDVPVAQAPLEEIKDVDIITCFIYSKLNKELLEKFTNLKLIATMSTGFDHIDLEYCKEKGIVVCNVPAYGDNTVAEHAFGLLLNLSKNIHKGYKKTREGDFSYDGLRGFDLKNKTIGVLGTGRIGQCSIKIAKGFQMNVIAYDPFQKDSLQEELGFVYKSLDEVLAESDIITIHVPLLPTTNHLINKEAIDKMKDGVIIINTSRGPLIDTEALITGLQTGKVGGAGLDVLEGENIVKDELDFIKSHTSYTKEQLKLVMQDHTLMKMDNVLVTPHLAFYTKEALQRILDTTLTNVFDCIEGRDYKHQVNK